MKKSKSEILVPNLSLLEKYSEQLRNQNVSLKKLLIELEKQKQNKIVKK